MMLKRLDAIQLLRGIAALMVCCFHMKALLNRTHAHLGDSLFGEGSIGVSIFFIISGFIMVYTTRDSDGSYLYFRNFMIKRLIRIIPLYYIMTLFWVFVYDTHLDYFSKDFPTLFKSLCFVPIFNSTVGPAYGMPPLKVGWSLNYELFFYIVFGVSLFMKRYRWVALFGTLTSLVLIVPLLSKGTVSFSPSYNYHFQFQYLAMITNPMMIYFIMGAVLGLIYQSGFYFRSKWVEWTILALAIALFFSVYCKFGFWSHGFFGSLIICWLLVFSCIHINRKQGIPIPGFLTYLGNMSYSLYLIHPTIIIFLPMILRLIGLKARMDNTLYFFVLLAVVLALSSVSYELIEKRLLKKLATILTRTKKVNSPVYSVRAPISLANED